jgi:hypothetical protein
MQIKHMKSQRIQIEKKIQFQRSNVWLSINAY